MLYFYTAVKQFQENVTRKVARWHIRAKPRAAISGGSSHAEYCPSSVCVHRGLTSILPSLGGRLLGPRRSAEMKIQGERRRYLNDQGVKLVQFPPRGYDSL